MKYSTGLEYLLAGDKVGTFKGFKETNSGLLLRFLIIENGKQTEQLFSKHETIKTI
jgi:hypothetical protein